jgi:twitching motility protein PilT
MAHLFHTLFLNSEIKSSPYITDYIIQPGNYVWVRINRKWQKHPEFNEKPTSEQVRELVQSAEKEDVVKVATSQGATSETFAIGGAKFAQNNYSFEIEDESRKDVFRYRVHLSNEMQGVEVNVRVLRAGEIDARDLGFTDSIIERLMRRKTGLIVVAGKTGSGKSTTLAALVKEIGRFYPESRLITVEAPIEYALHQTAGLHVSQRQVGTHVESFKTGILNIKRESADFAMVGEIPNVEEINGVFEAASAGHLVLTTCHAETIPKTLDFLRRGGNSEDMQQRIATYLNAIIVQELVPASGEGYHYPALAYEVMINDPQETREITSLLKKGNWESLDLKEGQGQFPMEVRLRELIEAKKIDPRDPQVARALGTPLK